MDEKVVTILRFLHNVIEPGFCEVAVAGSFATYAYMTSVLAVSVDWIPNDCNVFVATDDKEVFKDMVAAFWDYVRDEEDLYCPKPRFRKSDYMNNATVLTFVNFLLPGQLPIVSFVQHPSKSNIRDILQDFDIDVCKVALYFKHGEQGHYILEPSVREALLSATATVTKRIVWDRRAPTEQELEVLTRTYRRMKKYQDRGFVFADQPVPDSIENGAVQFVPMQLSDDSSTVSDMTGNS